MSARIRRLSSSLVILVVGLVLLTSPLLAAGKLDFVAKFKQGSLELNVATYTERNSTTGKLDKVGLLALAAGTLRNSFASDGPQWPQLIALVAKAAKAQSAGNKWTVVGAISETGTSDVSHLVVSAGPGIRFALNSPKGASLPYELPKSDIGRLQQAMAQVRQFLAAP
jgi:hypothetical protein